MVSDQVHPGREGLRTVILRHTLTDASSHLDWMFETRRGGALVTFRLGVRIDDPTLTEFHAEKIGDHRATYLEYEGEVGGGRGRVVRVAAGNLDLAQWSESDFEARVMFLGQNRHWKGAVVGGALWRFTAVTGGAAR